MDLKLLDAEPTDAEREAIDVVTIDAIDPKSGTAEFKATAIRLEAV